MHSVACQCHHVEHEKPKQSIDCFGFSCWRCPWQWLRVILLARVLASDFLIQPILHASTSLRAIRLFIGRANCIFNDLLACFANITQTFGTRHWWFGHLSITLWAEIGDGGTNRSLKQPAHFPRREPRGVVLADFSFANHFAGPNHLQQIGWTQWPQNFFVRFGFGNLYKPLCHTGVLTHAIVRNANLDIAKQFLVSLCRTIPCAPNPTTSSTIADA